ncbi:hypothetical protein WFJ45_22670, partial [Salmonella enterica subsp. enterica serovar Minnesota]|uniref:hypothetical protein n=1 Tax=Salmonella enterica TaxID=28901 RepID=UPI003D2D3335
RPGVDEPLAAEHPEIPLEHALQGFDAVRAYSTDPERSRALLEQVLGVVSVTSLLVVTVVIAGIALARRRPWLAAG